MLARCHNVGDSAVAELVIATYLIFKHRSFVPLVLKLASKALSGDAIDTMHRHWYKPVPQYDFERKSRLNAIRFHQFSLSALI